MSYRVRRKFTSSEFYVEGQLCKIFLEPVSQFRPGFYLWNTGFAIGNSSRQLNDWYWKRKNKRARSLTNKFNGKSGIKAIRRGFEELLRLRWVLPPGDCLMIDSTSGTPTKQFRAFSRWCRYHPEWTFNPTDLEFFWHRPPYIDDPVRKNFKIIPITPENPIANTDGSNYFDCFRVEPKVPVDELSMEQIASLLSPVLRN